MAEQVCEHLNLPAFTPYVPLNDMLIIWMGKLPRSSSLQMLPFHMMWIIWKARNQVIFEGIGRNIYSIVRQIITSVQVLSHSTVTGKLSRRILGKPPSKIYPCGYFDGASNCMLAGVGFCIHLNDYHHLEFSLGVEQGTNTKVELLSLWALLLTSQMMGIPLSHVYGDSLVIINWAKGSTALSLTDLVHWCRETKKLFSSF